MSEKSLEKIWTKSFINISLTQFLVFVVFYTLLMTLPIYVINDLGQSQSNAGLIVSFMMFSAIMIRPFSGKILDIIGKKKGLMYSVILFALTTMFYLGMDQFIPLLIVRFVHGISFGVLTTVTSAIVAETVPKSRSGTGMGYFAMANNLAIVIGPFIGLTLLQYVSFHTLFIVLIGIMLVSVLCAWNVAEPKKVAVVDEEDKKTAIKWSDLIEIKALPVAIITGLIGFVYASIISFISIYAEELGLAATASYFFLVFAVVMISFRPYLGRVFDEKGARIVLLPCLLIFAFGMLLLGFTNSALLLLVSAAFIGLGYGTLIPGFQTLAIQSTEVHRSSYAMSTFYIFFDIGIAAGAYVWGLVVMGVGFHSMYMITAACIVVIAIVFHVYMIKFHQKNIVNEGM